MFFCIRVLCLLLGTPNSKHETLILKTSKNHPRCLSLGGGRVVIGGRDHYQILGNSHPFSSYDETGTVWVPGPLTTAKTPRWPRGRWSNAGSQKAKRRNDVRWTQLFCEKIGWGVDHGGLVFEIFSPEILFWPKIWKNEWQWLHQRIAMMSKGDNIWWINVFTCGYPIFRQTQIEDLTMQLFQF